MKQYSFLIICLLILFPLVSAEVNIGETPSTIRGVFIEIPEAPEFNNATGGVNSSEFAEIWITNEGNKDNVADILLNEIGDVDATSPTNESVLSFNADSGNWLSIVLDTFHLQLRTFFFNKTDIRNGYYNKTDLLVRNEGTISYNRTVSGNDVTMSAIDYGINW